jgi:hypothetical protein
MGTADTLVQVKTFRLLGGKAYDLIELIKSVSMAEAEDDRAVLMDFMYKNPEKVLPDHDLNFFGIDRDGMRYSANNTCSFRSQRVPALQFASLTPIQLRMHRVNLIVFNTRNGKENNINSINRTSIIFTTATKPFRIHWIFGKHLCANTVEQIKRIASLKIPT